MTHEALIRGWPRLRGWLDEDRDGLRVHRQLTDAARGWRSVSRDPGALYRGVRLATARDWAGHGDGVLTRHEREFLDASIAADRREHRTMQRRTRQLRWLSAGLAALLAVSVTITTVALRQRQQAITQQRIATSLRLAAQALAAPPTDTGMATRWSLEAWRAAPTAEARSALLSVAARPYHDVRVSLGKQAAIPIALSGDGRWLAAFTFTNSLKIWDLTGRSPTGVLAEPWGFSTSDGQWDWSGAVAFDPDRQRMAVATTNGHVQLWNLPSRSLISSIPAHVGAGLPGYVSVRGLAFNADGRLLASIGVDGSVKVWDLDTSQQLHTLSLPDHPDRVAAFSPDGRILAIAGADGRITLWHLATNATTVLPSGQHRDVSAMAFSPDGRRLATTGEDTTVTLWDTDGGTRVADLRGHTKPVTGLAFTSDGTALLSAGADNTVIMWDVQRQALRSRLTTHEPTGLHGVSITADGTVTAIGSDAILVWHHAHLPFTGHTATVRDVVFGPDRQQVTAIGGDDLLITWDVEHRRIRRSTVLPHSAYKTAFSPDGRRLATMDDHTITIWDLTSHQPLRRIDIPTERKTPAGNPSGTDVVAFSPDGRLLATARKAQRMDVWDILQNRQIADVSTGGVPVSLVFAPDGQSLAVICDNGNVDIFRSFSNIPSIRLAGFGNSAVIAFHPDGRHLAFADATGGVHLWELGREVLGFNQPHLLADYSGPVHTLAFSPDGRLLLAAGDEGKIIIWEMATQAHWATLTSPEAVTSLAWHPDSTGILTSGQDHTLDLWTTDTEHVIDQLCARLLQDSPGPPSPPCPRR
jgi:WD40 repeat protein